MKGNSSGSNIISDAMAAVKIESEANNVFDHSGKNKVLAEIITIDRVSPDRVNDSEHLLSE